MQTYKRVQSSVGAPVNSLGWEKNPLQTEDSIYKPHLNSTIHTCVNSMNIKRADIFFFHVGLFPDDFVNDRGQYCQCFPMKNRDGFKSHCVVETFEKRSDLSGCAACKKG